MKKKYMVSSIFDESGVSLNEIISNFFISFLDEDLN